MEAGLVLIILLAAYVALKYSIKRAIFGLKKVIAKFAIAVLAVAGAVLAGIVVKNTLGVATASFLAVGLAGVFLLWLSMRARPQSGIADVVDDAHALDRLARAFDPAPHVKKAQGSKNDVVFLGLNEARKPVFFPRARLDKNHIEILGESGVGKSSLAGVLLSQLAAAGEIVVVFDPKADRMLPGVLARCGRENGFQMINIDLRHGQPPQINPFRGARQDQVEELLQVALDLGKTGQGAVDFYRGKDREAAGFMAQAFADGEASVPELLSRAAEDDRVIENENLWREFRQIARIPAFQVTRGGHDLESLLSSPGVIYVTGSTTKLEVQAAQKLLLQRILQILDERRDQSRPVAIFLDELKYILSPAALRAAGTIRDRNAHLIFAHQSLGDLSDCPGLDPKAVRGAVWGNCGLKIAYKMLDAETARELSLIAGERVAGEKRVTESSNGESVAYSQGRASHMPAHVFTHLPKPSGKEASVGVMIGDGPAYFLATRWLESGDAPAPIPATPPDGEPVPVASEVAEFSYRTPDVSAAPAAEDAAHAAPLPDDAAPRKTEPTPEPINDTDLIDDLLADAEETAAPIDESHDDLLK